MPALHLIIIYSISLLLLLLPSFGLSKMFEKAGVQKWKAFVPFYNTWIIQSLTQRAKHWVFWQIIPVVGWFITPGIYIEVVKLFRRYSLLDHTLAALFAPFYFIYLGFSKKVLYVAAGKENHAKKAWREWADAAVFAIVAAVLIRTFVFEAYAIPSGSMEKTLLVNDYLFVSKTSYGPRIPNTPLSIPFVHNYIPGTSLKSYSKLAQLGYIRWFSSPIKRGDPVVFNVPIGDTVINRENFQTLRTYYEIKREAERGDISSQAILSNAQDYPVLVHPYDKADNYIKRCVGIAGDVLEIRGGNIYINNKPLQLPPQSQMYYLVETYGQTLDKSIMREEYGLDIGDESQLLIKGMNIYEMFLTADAADRMRTNGLAKNITLLADDLETKNYTGILFPYDLLHQWSLDDYGPLWIPKKGFSLKLTAENYSVYERAIRVYEGNEFEMKGGRFFLNGKEATSYTFKMDYYWMMGDNRHYSQDSRFWGFVPEDRIVGKPTFIFFSWQKGPRWKRFFKAVK